MFYVLRKLIITVPVNLCNLLIYGKILLYHSNLNKNSKTTKKIRAMFLIFDSSELSHLSIMIFTSLNIFSVSYTDNRPGVPSLHVFS